MFRAVIFDLDGTLLNTLDDLADSGNHVLAAHGLPLRTIEEYRQFVGNGIPKLTERILPDDASEELFESCLAEFKAYYDIHKSDKTAPYEGMAELLSSLRASGIKTCVLSNKQHDMCIEVVEHYFGRGTFDIIQGKLDKFPPKPSPDSCNAIIKSLGIPKDNVLYVGDSDVDMRTAENAGLKKCGVSWGFRSIDLLINSGADFIAEKPKDIEAVIAEN